ncbi:MAG: Mo-dependent nitrogenase C-terminal domain-containing protein [Leptolyngbyaceae cyanobacterium bins.59]|nr:Mo-dependent nitrogenase C-terminal domain-containing protein [Leptolyngbyaceae cyanobacterium bins.59]
MGISNATPQATSSETWIWVESAPIQSSLYTGSSSFPKRDWLRPLRQWIDNYEIKDPAIAHQICSLIPTQCPFARDITFLGKRLLRIPPLCKLNPLYEEVVALRFRALCYLADECGEDVSRYC